MESYKKDPRVRTIFNAENNGSTFKQWNLGLSHANGEYIWFAESDDYADSRLLETLVDRLIGTLTSDSRSVSRGPSMKTVISYIILSIISKVSAQGLDGVRTTSIPVLMKP